MSNEIPDALAALLTDTELQNVKAQNGWAKGTAVEVPADNPPIEYEDCWFELLNGNGRAGNFGGVRLFIIHDEETVEEHLAYPSEDAYKDAQKAAGYYAKSFERDSVDVGTPVPQ
jgi:hypothetical protein